VNCEGISGDFLFIVKNIKIFKYIHLTFLKLLRNFLYFPKKGDMKLNLKKWKDKCILLEYI